MPQGGREDKEANATSARMAFLSHSIVLYDAMRRIVYNSPALRALRSMSSKTASRVRSKIEQYADDPASLSANVRKLQGRPGYRLRVGDYRVIFDEDGAILDILDIGHRSRIYD